MIETDAAVHDDVVSKGIFVDLEAYLDWDGHESRGCHWLCRLA